MPGTGLRPVTEAVMTALAVLLGASPALRIARSEVARVRKAPSRLIAITRRHSAKSSSLNTPPVPIPALTTAWSSRSIRGSSVAQKPSSATSAAWVSTSQERTSLPSPSPSRSIRMRRAMPCRSSQRAVAAPMPDAAPVTSAVRLEKSYPSVMPKGLAPYAVLSMAPAKDVRQPERPAHMHHAASFSSI